MPGGNQWLTEKPFAHRGLHDIDAGVPENSRAAFRAAIAAGFGIELDVRLSRDGVAMVFHDAALDRLCGRPGLVRDTDSVALGKMPLLGTAETPPTLEEALGIVGGRVGLLIEIKNSGLEPVEPIAAAVADTIRNYPGPAAIQAFNPRILAWFAANAPDVARGQIIDLKPPDGRFSYPRLLVLRVLLAIRHGAPQFVAYDFQRLPAPLADRAKRDGLPLLAWTIRTPAQRARAKQLVDNIIFEAGGRPG
jgi:glycerophosphoryl diester phosphodiesterase